MGQDVGCDAAPGMAYSNWLIRRVKDVAVISTGTYVHHEKLVELSWMIYESRCDASHRIDHLGSDSIIVFVRTAY